MTTTTAAVLVFPRSGSTMATVTVTAVGAMDATAMAARVGGMDAQAIAMTAPLVIDARRPVDGTAGPTMVMAWARDVPADGRVAQATARAAGKGGLAGLARVAVLRRVPVRQAGTTVGRMAGRTATATAPITDNLHA
jgi:hypothetical protein